MISKVFTVTMASMFFLQMAKADPAAKTATPAGGIPAGKGSLSASGKFEPTPSKDLKPIKVPTPSERLAQPDVIKVGDKYMIGSVELDSKARTVTIPAKVHRHQGLLEYLLVHTSGKLHEALFVTDVLPQDIHVACLLLGWGEDKSRQTVSIHVEWLTNGPARFESIDSFVGLTEGGEMGKVVGQLNAKAWEYTGSIIDVSGFAAAVEGSIIAIINDPAALVNNAQPSTEREDSHVPIASKLPPVGTPVKIIFKANPKMK